MFSCCADALFIVQGWTLVVGPKGILRNVTTAARCSVSQRRVEHDTSIAVTVQDEPSISPDGLNIAAPIAGDSDMKSAARLLPFVNKRQSSGDAGEEIQNNEVKSDRTRGREKKRVSLERVLPARHHHGAEL